MLVIYVVALSSVCGACAISDDILCQHIENKPVVVEEWTIEIGNTSENTADKDEDDTNLIEVVQFSEKSFNSGEWTLCM